MGLARRFERGGDHGLTQSGMTLGTFDYISPEQARDPRDVDVRSDLYSLGCTLFHMLTGRPPFPGGTVLAKADPASGRGAGRRTHAQSGGSRRAGWHHHQADGQGPGSALPDARASGSRAAGRCRNRRTGAGIAGGPAGTSMRIGPRGSRIWFGWFRSWDLSWWSWALAWWGRDPSPAMNSSPRSNGPRVSEFNVVTGPVPTSSLPPSAASDGGPASAGSAPAYPRNIPVSSNEDLLEILTTAPRRSVIVLSDDGPYRVGGRTWAPRSLAPLANPDLVIKAEPGVRPLVKFADDAGSSDHPLASLLQFVGGHVTIEGLKFELDAVLPEDLVTAIRTEDTELLGARMFVPAHQRTRRTQLGRDSGADRSVIGVWCESPAGRGRRFVPFRWRTNSDTGGGTRRCGLA